ncbi:MAG: hypothetical protein ACKVOO_08115 [Burkholderiaceae bacterium]
MSAMSAFLLRYKKTWIGLLLFGLALMWWAALSKKSIPPAPGGAAQRMTGGLAAGANVQEQIALPSQIERQPLEASNRDPFAVYLPPQPKPPAPKKAPPPMLTAVSPPPQAVAAPSPPPLNLRFLGQATTPEGERLIYAALGDTPVLLSKGANLPNGYQVTSIEPRFVTLMFTPLNFLAQLALPEPPRYEIR